MYGFKFSHARKRLQHQLVKNRTSILAIVGACCLIACDGAVQLCGRYACVHYQTSHQSNCTSNRTCSAPKQCEAAGSIRDRAPRIINELRSAQRTCTAGLQTQNSARLIWDADLASAAAFHSRDMAENLFEAFDGTNGQSTVDRVEFAGFSAAEVVESINSGPQTAAEVINDWLDVQTDCSQMLTSNTSRIGMACTISGKPDSEPYWSLVLARPDGNAIQQ